MRDLGIREIAGLLALLLAIAVAAVYLNPAAGGSSPDGTPTISLGVAVPSSTPAPSPTATAVPPTSLIAPAGWIVKLFEIRGGEETFTSQVGASKLDVSIPNGPSVDIQDDSWGMSAEASFRLEAAGQYRIAIEHDCEARIMMDGVETAHAADPGKTSQLEVLFEHSAGTATIVIECRDRGGPFRLAFLAP